MRYAPKLENQFFILNYNKLNYFILFQIVLLFILFQIVLLFILFQIVLLFIAIFNFNFILLKVIKLF